MMSHTKEPWTLCEVENDSGRIKHLVPVDSEKLSLLTLVENDQATFAAIYNDADARRIVACVNACEGIPTETLERRGMIPVSALEAQRGELLAAVKNLIDQKGRHHTEIAYRRLVTVYDSMKGGA